ncbi:MAG: hypothetical protein RL318_1414 [Fibrobacterota bacterium]|jgi:uncharacterized protein (TIRG00374 family)
MRTKFRKVVAPVAQVAATILLLSWILWRNDAPRIFSALKQAEPVWLAGGASVLLASLFLGAFQWDLLLRHQGVRIAYRRLLHAYNLGTFLNFVLPTGVGGDVVRAIAVHRESQGGAKSFAATILDRFAGLFTLSILAFLAAMLLSSGRHDPFFARLVFLTGAASFAFVVAAALLFSRRALGWLAPVAKFLGEGKLFEMAKGMRQAFLEYRAAWPLVGQIVSISLLTQFLRISVHAFCAQALGLKIDFAWFLLFVPVVALISVLPISVGGWGLREGVQKTFFALPGVMIGITSSQDAAAMGLALAFLTSVVGMLVPAIASLIGGLLHFLAGARAHEKGHA